MPRIRWNTRMFIKLTTKDKITMAKLAIDGTDNYF